MELSAPESWENFGQIVMTLIWFTIAIGVFIFVKGTIKPGESKAKQELERRRQAARDAEKNSSE